MEESGRLPEYDHPEAGGYLLRAASDLGMCRHDPISGQLEPVPLGEVLRCVGIPGSPVETWQEAKTVADICAAYVKGIKEGENVFSVPPWERD